MLRRIGETYQENAQAEHSGGLKSEEKKSGGGGRSYRDNALHKYGRLVDYNDPSTP